MNSMIIHTGDPGSPDISVTKTDSPVLAELLIPVFSFAEERNLLSLLTGSSHVPS